ncbi:type VI secretion system-associated FHA domain protein TagH [uncultured Lamprocystis sp.]|jgi:type VI secretion system FHA domain protein|uniref:type VI secretion system-associated FHA domain protein TagH n=1 Tax=uncultured Lamprocystis sp. TaxID=543132 RepID=UPI0025D18031|nr:type VI secretion system-associated FHA domain protein TagH [uncultured Lamprocystis sp.]
MEYTITVARYGGVAPERPASWGVSARGCTIGRSPDNDLPLSDPERVISGHHARVELRDGSLWVTDLSTNGIFLNEAAERLPVGQRVQIQVGDILHVGGYELCVETGAAYRAPAEQSASHATDPFGFGDDEVPTLGSEVRVNADIMDILGPSGQSGVPMPGTPRAPAPSSAAAGRAQAEDPFADAVAFDSYLGGPAERADAPLITSAPTPFEHVYLRAPETQPTSNQAASNQAVSSQPQRPAEPLFPDEYDLMADALGPAAASPAAVPAVFAEPVWTEPFAPAAAPESAFDAPAVAAPVVDTPTFDEPLFSAFEEPDAGLTTPSVAPAAPPAAVVEPTPRTAAGPAAAEPGPLTVAAPAALPGGNGSGLAAFLAGLGTGDPTQVRDPDLFLREAGQLMRDLTAGLTATMQVRAQFKSELRCEVTTIRAVENNPYKFAVGVDEALERLFFRSGPGYLPASEAARAAFEDIQAHEMAMIAGLRAALRALLARFEPAELEQRLGAGWGLDKLLPMARKARFWDLFTETFAQVATDAADDFMQLFGDAFTHAYEDQIQRLAQARAKAAGPTAGRGPGRSGSSP